MLNGIDGVRHIHDLQVAKVTNEPVETLNGRPMDMGSVGKRNVARGSNKRVGDRYGVGPVDHEFQQRQRQRQHLTKWE